MVVRNTAKIHILKQFTTYQFNMGYTPTVVRNTAKIHILKQFTTKLMIYIFVKVLCVILQRYTF
ncbi:hypothetical protein SAMN05444364_11835 [Prevotella scopos JCM 17725]|uniref:Uncharacterized protein n=1 Tax=Prevotella scopos JCM 17725 TaxID=1236518 RepID=A0AAX2F4J0_9BACT|nr:hypothetical protein SAMN05444364_11835 [Prevotella scopos JCM 17725]